MKNLLLCLLVSLLLVVVAGKPQAPSAPSASEPIEDVEEDLDDSDETTDPPLTDDEHCEEVEKLKDYYCTTAHCKHFYSKHCYDIVDGVHPTCEVVRKCIETRLHRFMDKTDKKAPAANSGSSLQPFVSLVVFCVMKFIYNL
jgi:hypothetical protein